MKEIQITALEQGQRLDRLLDRFLKNTSRGFVYKMLRKKNITLNGKKASGHETLQDGDVIRLYFADETLRRFLGENAGTEDMSGSGREADHQYPAIPLDILYEDDHVILINKPAGMLSQKAKESDVSLCEYLIGYLLRTGFLQSSQLTVFRPSVCNRLDLATSGIVACGKTTEGLQALTAMFRDRTMDKQYQTMVFGHPAQSMTLEGYLTKDEKTNQVSVRQSSAPDAKVIRTAFRTRKAGVLSAGKSDIPAAYLHVDLITGRSHQIRAHLSSIGHPILGDPKYGRADVNRLLKDRFGVHAQLLHCGMITFPETDGVLHPLSNKTVRAPLPDPFDRVLRGLH